MLLFPDHIPHSKIINEFEYQSFACSNYSCFFFPFTNQKVFENGKLQFLAKKFALEFKTIFLGYFSQFLY